MAGEFPEYDPGEGFERSDGFGERVDPMPPHGIEKHPGMDWRAREGTPVPSASDGEVVYSAYNGAGYGYTVIVKSIGKDGRPYYPLYGHMNGAGMAAFGRNDIKAGSIIGYSGNTGRSTGPHLHFEIIKDKTGVNEHGSGGIGFKSSILENREDPKYFGNWGRAGPFDGRSSSPIPLPEITPPPNPQSPVQREGTPASNPGQSTSPRSASPKSPPKPGQSPSNGTSADPRSPERGPGSSQSPGESGGPPPQLRSGVAGPAPLQSRPAPAPDSRRSTSAPAGAPQSPSLPPPMDITPQLPPTPPLPGQGGSVPPPRFNWRDLYLYDPPSTEPQPISLRVPAASAVSDQDKWGRGAYAALSPLISYLTRDSNPPGATALDDNGSGNPPGGLWASALQAMNERASRSGPPAPSVDDQYAHDRGINNQPGVFPEDGTRAVPYLGQAGRGWPAIHQTSDAVTNPANTNASTDEADFRSDSELNGIQPFPDVAARPRVDGRASSWRSPFIAPGIQAPIFVQPGKRIEQRIEQRIEKRGDRSEPSGIAPDSPVLPEDASPSSPAGLVPSWLQPFIAPGIQAPIFVRPREQADKQDAAGA